MSFLSGHFLSLEVWLIARTYELEWIVIEQRRVQWSPPHDSAMLAIGRACSLPDEERKRAIGRCLERKLHIIEGDIYYVVLEDIRAQKDGRPLSEWRRTHEWLRRLFPSL